jgi:hypothetical protein
VPIVGGHIDLTNLVLKNVDFTAQQIGLVPPNQVTVDLNNFSGELDLDWEYHGPLGIHFHGSGTNKFSDTSIKTLFDFASDAQGRPVVTLQTCDVKINDLDIHLSGGGAWLWNFIIGLFKPLLIDILQKKIDSVATSEFDAILAGIEAKFPLSIPLTGRLNTTQVDIGLVPTPSVNTNAPAPFEIDGQYLVTSGEWMFQSTTNSTVDPRPHDWIPSSMPASPSGTPPMFGIAMDEYFLGSLLFTLTQNHVLDLHVDNDSLGPKSIIKLTTKLFSTEWPALYQKYPDYNMTIDCTQWQDQPPLSTTSPSGTTWSNQMQIMFNVVDPAYNPPEVAVLQLLVDLQLATIFTVNDNTTSTMYLQGQIDPLTINGTIVWSAFDPGTVEPTIIGIINDLANDLLIPLLNKFLSQGIPVPAVLGPIPLKNFFVSYGEHEMAVGFDIGLGSEREAVAFVQGLKRKPHPKELGDDEELLEY